MKGNVDTRIKLGKLVSPENEENWWRPELFEKNMRRRLPKEIEIVMLPPAEKTNYNCFIFVLGLQNDQRFIGEEGWKFMRDLDNLFGEMIKNGIIERVDELQSGDVILYRTDKGLISHVGLIEGEDLVLSKWSWGPLLRHKIWDVPDHYGDKIEFYKISQKARDFVIAKYNKLALLI